MIVKTKHRFITINLYLVRISTLKFEVPTYIITEKYLEGIYKANKTE